MEFFLQIFIIFLKILVPGLLLKFPFQAAWGNYFLDVIDGDVLLSLGMKEEIYQILDKFTDYISYIFMLIVGLRWKIRKLIVLFFVYRSIGQVLYFITRNEMVFFYFQNFLEPLVMAYSLLIFIKKSETLAFKSYIKHIRLIWAIIIIYKVWNEWYLHLANIDLSTFFFGISG